MTKQAKESVIAVQQTQPVGALTLKSLFERDDVRGRFRELLGKRASGFMTSVLQVMSGNAQLQSCEPMSIYNAAATAAILDMPVNSNIGQAYIVPYKGKAQLQIGYKGFVQLAQRTGKFKNISVSAIYDGQIVKSNPLTGFEFDFSKKGERVVGYAAYFSLLNGFEKILYMTVEEITAHGKRYSQTFKNGGGLWVTNFDSMAEKTLLKLLLSKYAPLSVEMEMAIKVDQSVIEDDRAERVKYVDVEEVKVSEVTNQVSEVTKSINNQLDLGDDEFGG